MAVIAAVLGLCVASTTMAEDRSVSFRREVVPLLTKHGCATGACHGSPSGKGGFRLSLRGFDASVDEATVIREDFGRRVNTTDPEQSLLLRKPTMAIAHGGGRRLRRTDPAYTVLRDWIAQGCRVDSVPGSVCTELKVQPYSQERAWPDVKFSLRIEARFDDGAVRDVTALVDFLSTDEQVATVTTRGDVTGIDRGDVVVLARYLDQIAVAPLTILKPVEGFAWADPPAHNEIDRLLFAKQRQLQIVPSDLCTDGEFIRRLYLDVLGILPTAEEAQTFVEGSAEPDRMERTKRRAALIEHVLARDEYAEFWASKWADLLQVKASKLSASGVHKFHQWLVRAMRSDLPYDRFVTELITARGDTFEVPAANFYRVATDTDSCSETVAQLFLGIRMQCAKCHNHPYERWTQDHYYGIGAVFSRVGRRAIRGGEETLVHLTSSGEVTHLRTGKTMSPFVPLTGLLNIEPDGDRRVAFAKWLASPGNPFFARVGVNRLWAHVMGRGLVDPVDDFRDSNPASHPELLDWLAGRFSESGFNQRELLRLILNSRTYQLGSKTNSFNERDVKLFSHARSRRLTSEQHLDAICHVTGVPEKFIGFPVGTRATQLPSPPDVGSDFLFATGLPRRNTACECERNAEPNLAQALFVINSNMLSNKLTNPRGRLSQHLNRLPTAFDAAMTLPSRSDGHPIDGLQLWLRADAGLLDPNGVPPDDGGESVASWQDQSPLARRVISREATQQPKFVAGGIGSRPSLRFDGNDLLHDATTNLLDSGSPRTVIMVAQADETSPGGALFTLRRSTSGGQPVCSLQQVMYSGTHYIYSDGVHSPGNSSIAPAIETIRKPFVATFAFEGAGKKLKHWLNGERQSVTQAGGVGADTGATGFTVGQREDYPTFGWQGLIAEVLVYDRILPDDDLAALHKHLTARYRLDAPAARAPEQPTAETDAADKSYLTELYWLAFSRAPRADEYEPLFRHIHMIGDRRIGLEDVTWAVLNSKEFLFQH